MAVLGVLSGVITSPLLRAQDDSTSLARCLARLPQSAFTRVTVYLEADTVHSTPHHLLEGVDFLTQSVATRVRALLGAPSGEIPPADSILGRSHLGGRLILGVYADGRFGWSTSDLSKTAHEARRPARELLHRALAETQWAGERVYFPAPPVREPVYFAMSYRWPAVTSHGAMEPLRARRPIPVFTLPVPSETPAVLAEPLRIKYPRAPLNDSAEYTLLLRYVVDTVGRVKMATVNELWPPEQARPSGKLGDYYQAFFHAVKAALRQARYEPARTGGCPIHQLVHQPFTFKLRR